DKLQALNCSHEIPVAPEARHNTMVDIPTIEIDPASPSPDSLVAPLGAPTNKGEEDVDDEKQIENKHHHCHHPPLSKFHKHFHAAATRGRIHDVLQFKNGASWSSVVSWNIM